MPALLYPHFKSRREIKAHYQWLRRGPHQEEHLVQLEAPSSSGDVPVAAGWRDEGLCRYHLLHIWSFLPDSFLARDQLLDTNGSMVPN